MGSGRFRRGGAGGDAPATLRSGVRARWPSVCSTFAFAFGSCVFTSPRAAGFPAEAGTPRKHATVPLIVGGLAIGLLAFGLGRRTTPTNAPGDVATAPAESGSPAADGGEAASGEPSKKAGEAAKGTIAFDEQSERLAGIQVRTVALRQLATGIPFNGQIAPDPNGVVRVASLVPGRVTHLTVAQGTQVRQGQVLAIVESRAIGEAQSAFVTAQSRAQNAGSNLNVVLQQARAGVFARAPIEAARRSQADAQADVAAQETAVLAVLAATVALDNVRRLARSGSFASPALEAARSQQAAAVEAVRTAEAALSNAQASVRSAQSELARRRGLAASGSYVSRPVEEARRFLVAAQSARAAAESEVATTRINLARVKTLSSEGLVSQRGVENAQNAFDTATARLTSTQSDETTAGQELARQQRLGASNVTGTAEVAAAQSALASAQSDVATRRAEVVRAREGLRLAGLALARERSVFGQGVANRREIGAAQTNLENAQTALKKARQTLVVANATFARARRILGARRIPLGQIADIVETEGPVQLSRENGEGRNVIQMNVRGSDLGAVVQALQKRVARDVLLPPGYRLEYGGTYEKLQSGRARLMIVVPITFAVIFLLLFTTFGSLKQAALVFTGIPFAVTGGVLALYLRGLHFSLSAGIGFIALFGVAVLNGVVLITFINELRESGVPLGEAVQRGCETRLRPVLMTATVASIGFLPMAFGHGAGGEVQKPLATVVIGGFLTSTILTLFVLPMLYNWFEKDEPREVEV